MLPHSINDQWSSFTCYSVWSLRISKAKNQLCDASHCKNLHFDPINLQMSVILLECPQPQVSTHGLSHLSLECSRNSSGIMLNLYFDQRAACYCSLSFYHIVLICSGRDIVYLIEVNPRMLALSF